jgi:hypothetical protein
MDTKEFREAGQRRIDWIAEYLDSSALGLTASREEGHCPRCTKGKSLSIGRR